MYKQDFVFLNELWLPGQGDLRNWALVSQQIDSVVRPRWSKLRGDGVCPLRSVFASHLLVSFRFSRESIRRGGLWFAVMLSCSTWPLITPPHPTEDSQEPLASPADEMKIFHLSLLKPLSDNNPGESDPPAEKSIYKERNTYISEWRFCL